MCSVRGCTWSWSEQSGVRTSAVRKQAGAGSRSSAAARSRTHTRARIGHRPGMIYARDKLHIVPLSVNIFCQQDFLASVTRSRLVYQTTFQRSSRKISPWGSSVTNSPISCAIHCSVSNCNVYRKRRVWMRSLSIYCWVDVGERASSRRILWTEGGWLMALMPGYIWDTFSGI